MLEGIYYIWKKEFKLSWIIPSTLIIRNTILHSTPPENIFSGSLGLWGDRNRVQQTLMTILKYCAWHPYPIAAEFFSPHVF